jgi:ferritin-like metal-binding protein YciE
MKLDSLETLLLEELRDLYNAERQILKALPKMANAASSPDLEKGFGNICNKPKRKLNVSTRSFQI